MSGTTETKKLLLTITAALAAILIIILTSGHAFAAAVDPVVTVSSTKANQIQVSWTSVEGASSYNVYRCDKNSPYRKIASTTETSYLDTTVENDKPYEYSVTAVVDGQESLFNNKGAVGYTAYKAPHVYGWTVSDLTPWTFTVSGKVSYAGTASSIQLPVWTEANGQDDLRWYTVPVTNNQFSYTILTSNHGSQRGVYVLDPYLNGTSIYCSSPLWVEVPTGPLLITAPAVVDLSETGFTATAVVKAFNNHFKSATAEIWTAFNGQDDLEKVTASYDSTTGVISCPVSVAKHNGENKLYYVRFTVTDGAGVTKNLMMSAYIPTTQKCMSLTIIDLGDGNIGGSATLLTSKGKALLIDTGRSESAEAVVTCLKQHGVKTVDIMITHGDGDHVGVSQALIDAGIGIGNVYTDNYPSDVMWDELDRRASMSVFSRYGTIKPVPVSLTVGDATIRTIGPNTHYSLYEAKANKMSQANANSYWFMITNGSRKVLINGDSELVSSQEMVRSGKDISADLYVLGHHGAAGSLDTTILNAISPSKTAASGRITSAITADTIKVLKNAGIPYYFTGAYGNIDISFRGSVMIFNTEKNADNAQVFHEVIWKNADGTILEKDSWVKNGAAPSYDGETPERARTAQYSYSFAGWSTDGKTVLSSLPAVTSDMTFIAVYQSTVNQYTITWKNADGTVLGKTTVPYGSMPGFLSEPRYPVHDSLTYVFAGWTPDLKKVTGAATYTAVYAAVSPKIVRLKGANRYGTAQAILQEAFPDHSQNRFVMASGTSFQHGILGVVLSGGYDCPLLITRNNTLSQETRSEIERLAADLCEIVIVGGTDMVSEAVETALLDMDVVSKVSRVAENEVSAAGMAYEVYTKGIRDELWADTDTVIIVSGSSFADETAIAPYARASRTPILMTDDGQNLPESIALDLADNGVRKAILIGGNAVVSDGTMEMLENLGIQCMRLSGANRYLTTLKIFDWLIGADPEAPIQPDPVFSLNTTGFATGLDFADAITSANLLGTNKSPILLVADKDSADKAMFEALSGREDQVATAYIFGGTSAVSIRVECRIADAVTRDVQ